MKELFDFNDDDLLEKGIGGIFGVVAILAAVAEVVIGGFSLESIISGIKDVSGTLIVVVLLISFIKSHKKVKGIRGSIESAMTGIEDMYNPLIRKEVISEGASDKKKNKLDKIVRYEIATDMGVLFSKESKSYAPFFEINLENPDSIEFYIRKKFFSDTAENPFDAKTISSDISEYMTKRYKDYSMKFKPDSSGGKFVISFGSPLKYLKDMEALSDVVDDMVFVYSALNKK